MTFLPSVSLSLADAEIGELHQVARPDHDVVGLDVLVDQAVLVRVVQRPADLARDLQRLADHEGAVGAQQLHTGAAVHELH